MTRLAPHPEPCLCPWLHATSSGWMDIPASSVGHQAKGCVFARNREKICVRDPWEKSFRRAGGDGWGSLRGRDDHQSLNEMITRAGSGPGRDWPSPRRARASFSFARGQASGHHLGPVSGFPGVDSPSSPPSSAGTWRSSLRQGGRGRGQLLPAQRFHSPRSISQT